MTTRKKKATPKTFKAAYSILKTNAEALQHSNEPDIDNLMTTVEQSIDAYKVCQARIEAVQKALDAAFNKDGEKNEFSESATQFGPDDIEHDDNSKEDDLKESE